MIKKESSNNKVYFGRSVGGMGPRIQKTIDFARVALRLNEITYIATRYGVADILTALGLETGKKGLGWVGLGKLKTAPYSAVLAKNLKLTFLRLGPSFIKLGQVLASRPDLIGEPMAKELKQLFDNVPPIPFKEIKEILENELGRETIKREIFWIEPKPLGSASLSQTHRARLKSGEEVILKVQKTGVDNTVKLDLEVFRIWAYSVAPLFPSFDLKTAWGEFRESTLRELDYREEAKSIERFKKNYSKLFSNSNVCVPSSFPQLTTQKVLVLEPMRGTQFSALTKGSTNARKAANQGITAVLEQVFEHGLFHADPHSGNLFFLEDGGQIGFIDFGMVGQLEEEDRQRFLRVLFAVLKRDKKKLAKALYELGTPSPKTNYSKFEASIFKLIEEEGRKGITNIRLDVLVPKLLRTARKHKIQIPNRYTLMLRSFLVIEGVAKSLDPKVSLVSIATPLVLKALVKAYSPRKLLRKLF